MQNNALLRFYFKIDPSKLSDEEYITVSNELQYALDFDAKRASTHGKFKF